MFFISLRIDQCRSARYPCTPLGWFVFLDALIHVARTFTFSKTPGGLICTPETCIFFQIAPRSHMTTKWADLQGPAAILNTQISVSICFLVKFSKQDQNVDHRYWQVLHEHLLHMHGFFECSSMWNYLGNIQILIPFNVSACYCTLGSIAVQTC